MISLANAKDPNELHKKNWRDFKTTFQQALDRAQPLDGAYAQPAPSSYEYTPSPFTLQELLTRQLPPIQWAIPDILPEGLTLLAGKPKLGKSWLALAMALAVAAGGVALGSYPVSQGEVLYLALEDNERRLQTRAQQLLATMTMVPNSIAFELRWPRLDQGGLMHLEEYLKAHPHVRLVVIDTWARVSPKAQHRQRSQYEDEYEALTPLKYLADTYRVSILAIHHLRKMRGDDVLDEITGSIGLTGAVDGALILKRERGQHEASLFVTGRDIEHEQQLALRFDAQTALWTLVGNAEEVRRTKERQDILDLLSEQFPEGMSPRQVAEALDKNYHTTRCLLRKLEAAGEIQHADSQYVAIPVEHSRNQRNQCNQRNQSVPSALQRDDQVARSEEPCRPAIDYVDYIDYAGESVSANVSQTYSIPPPFGGCSLQFSSASEDVLSPREDMQDAQEHRDVGVINRNQCNQRNQSISATTQVSDHVEQSSPKWIDYSDGSDYVDYADYANESVSAYWSQTPEPDPLPIGASIQYLSEAGDLLTEREDNHDAQDHQVDFADGIINRNQRNQSMSATTQVSDHVGHSSPKRIDYVDYANESVSAYWSQTLESDASLTGASLHHLSEAGDLLTEKEEIQNAQDHRVDFADGVINRNHRNQSGLPRSKATLQFEQSESDSALHTNDASSGKTRASPYAPGKKRCPHHPHAQWIRFDPSGQAWCDRMDCWDCYRLMKIGEAMDYRPISAYTRGIVTLEQGIEAWSSFVTTQGSFTVLTATQYAIDLCKAVGVEVPDLSGEVKRLVPVRE